VALKAKLKIQLFADKVVVAESEDEHLWRRTLAAIQGVTTSSEELGGTDSDTDLDDPRSPASKGVNGLVKVLGVKVSQLNGACEPSSAPPYLHLDAKYWESFIKDAPKRGASAISASQLAATILCLWFKYGEIPGQPTQAQTLDVLNGIGLEDPNISRSIKNCTWLQNRRGGIQINPAEMTKAESVAKRFITKQKPAAEE